MNRADTFPLPSSTWKADYLEDTSVRRLVLEQYDREAVPLRRYLQFLGIDPETAKEVVHEAFLKLHQHLLADGDRTNLRAWLYRVAHNVGRNTQTAFRSSKTDSLPDLSLAGNLPSQAASIEQELLEQERSRLVRSAMDRLSAAQKDCLVLRAQGFKYREIAEVLNLSVSTVGENIQRGLEKLKELL
ncbi:MAG TPA: RNA polymerase sigma factor [Bryobacteraceae bacterium]|jgi:RNA polymerase sigma-70 factor (ECF subfamily)|nr:RNA polymerase sigma factor [Bryobacteraceae bacterium]